MSIFKKIQAAITGEKAGSTPPFVGEIATPGGTAMLRPMEQAPPAPIITPGGVATLRPPEPLPTPTQFAPVGAPTQPASLTEQAMPEQAPPQAPAQVSQAPQSPAFNPIPPPDAATLPTPLTPLQQKQRDFEQIAAAPVKKQSPAKQILFMALQTIANAASGQNKSVEWLGNAKKNAAMAQAQRELEPLQQQEVYGQQKALRDAQIKTIPIDDENRRLEIEGRKSAAQDRIRAAALNKINSAKYYDPKNVANRRLAEQAGVDPDSLQGWDDRNPVTKQVAGVTYQYNRSTQSFEPSNLPTDEASTLTDYSVKTPTGEVRTYKVAQKDAARFATQMQALGMQIDAASTRQTNQQTFQAGENEKSRNQQVRMAGLQNDLSIKLADYKAKQDAVTKETDFERRKQLQTQAEQARKDLAESRQAFDAAMKEQ